MFYLFLLTELLLFYRYALFPSSPLTSLLCLRSTILYNSDGRHFDGETGESGVKENGKSVNAYSELEFAVRVHETTSDVCRFICRTNSTQKGM
jgi:hypothetical protein